jgi:hypothetical protein
MSLNDYLKLLGIAGAIASFAWGAFTTGRGNRGQDVPGWRFRPPERSSTETPTAQQPQLYTGQVQAAPILAALGGDHDEWHAQAEEFLKLYSSELAGTEDQEVNGDMAEFEEVLIDREKYSEQELKEERTCCTSFVANLIR